MGSASENELLAIVKRAFYIGGFTKTLLSRRLYDIRMEKEREKEIKR